MEVRPGGILAYDLATSIGWAYGHCDSTSPTFGGLLLPKVGGEGAKFAAAENEMAAHMELFRPRHVVAETPIPLPTLNNRTIALQLIGLRAIVCSEAYRASAQFHEWDSYTVRLNVLGTGRFKAGAVKEAVTRWCWGRGWDVGTHDQADACVLWEHARRNLRT